LTYTFILYFHALDFYFVLAPDLKKNEKTEKKTENYANLKITTKLKILRKYKTALLIFSK
jgi:hypothetical protein